MGPIASEVAMELAKTALSGADGSSAPNLRAGATMRAELHLVAETVRDLADRAAKFAAKRYRLSAQGSRWDPATDSRGPTAGRANRGRRGARHRRTLTGSRVAMLYLVRHGQTRLNAEDRLRGHADEPLDELGQEQAHALADPFETLPSAGLSPARCGRAADGCCDRRDERHSP